MSRILEFKVNLT